MDLWLALEGPGRTVSPFDFSECTLALRRSIVTGIDVPHEREVDSPL